MITDDHERPAHPRPLTAEPVLVVEDNHPNRVLLHAMLEALGCGSALAASGAEALDITRHQPFSLIFLDITMPGISGIETMKRLRAGAGANAATPIVALTGHAAADDHQRFLAAGAVSVLVKPVSPRKLADAIKRFARSKAPAPEPGSTAA